MSGLSGWQWGPETRSGIIVMNGAHVFATDCGTPHVVISGDDQNKIRSLALRVQIARDELRMGDTYWVYPNYDVTQRPIGYVQFFHDRETKPDVHALASCALIPAVSFDKPNLHSMKIENFGMVRRVNVDTRLAEDEE